MTSFSEHHGLEYVTCDHCETKIKPIIKRVSITMVGETNVDFCPMCDLPTRDGMNLSNGELADATVSDKPRVNGWLDYLGKGITNE